MLELLWSLTSRVYVFILIGLMLGWFIKGNGEKIVRIVISVTLYFLAPVFVFLSLLSNPVPFNSASAITLVALSVMTGGALLALGWSRFSPVKFRESCLPVAIMNSAYLAIPVNTLLWGAEGTNLSVIYNTVVTVVVFTAGIWCVSKKNAAVEILKIPVIYAAATGFALNKMGISPSPAVTAAGSVLAAVTLPAMLIFVGYRISSIKIRAFKDAVTGTALRMAGGFIIALSVVSLLDIRGAMAGVCIMTSSMPSAVQTYIIAEQFDSNPGFAASVIFLGTAAACIVIPLLKVILL